MVLASDTNGYPSYYLNLSKIIAEVKMGQLQILLKRRFGLEGKQNYNLLSLIDLEAGKQLLKSFENTFFNAKLLRLEVA